MNGRRVTRNWEPLGAGLAAAALSLLYQSPGAVLSHDSWVYWEGSLSLLRGSGYALLDGTPITSWPPGFSVYLALWQGLAGNSARTLVLAQALAVGAAAGIWTRAALRVAGHDAWRSLGWSIAVVFAVTFPIHHRVLLSEALFEALIGAIVALIVAGPELGISDEPAGANRVSRLAAIGLLLAAALLTRNVGVAAVPALAWLLVACARERRAPRSWVAPVVVSLMAVAAWIAARTTLGQRGSHELIEPADALGRFAELVPEGLVACWAIFAPVSARGVGVAIPAVLLAAALVARREPPRVAPEPCSSRPRPGDLVIATGIFFVGTAILIALSVPDPYGPRFVLPVAALLLVALGGGARRFRLRAGRGLAAAAIYGCALIAVVRAGYWIERSLNDLDHGLPWSTRLAAPCGRPRTECELAPDERISPLHDGQSHGTARKDETLPAEATRSERLRSDPGSGARGPRIAP